MIGVGPRFVVVLVILMALASVAGMVARLGVARSTLTASVRAVAQLSAVSLVIVLVLHSWSLALAFVVVMFAVACVTSARRIGRHRSSLWAATANGLSWYGPQGWSNLDLPGTTAIALAGIRQRPAHGGGDRAHYRHPHRRSHDGHIPGWPAGDGLVAHGLRRV